MFLTVVGSPLRLGTCVIERASAFFGGKLLGKVDHSAVVVEVVLERDFTYNTGNKGRVFKSGPSYRVTLDAQMSREKTLVTLAHELVHVKQMALGELEDHYADDQSITWMSREYHFGKLGCEEMDYWDLPWEIEAHGREYGLYHRFQEEQNRRKLSLRTAGLEPQEIALTRS